MGESRSAPPAPNQRKRYLDWQLDDPAGQGLSAVRPIRDDIEQRVRSLLTTLRG